MREEYITSDELKTMIAWLLDVNREQIILCYGDSFRCQIDEEARDE